MNPTIFHLAAWSSFMKHSCEAPIKQHLKLPSTVTLLRESLGLERIPSRPFRQPRPPENVGPSPPRARARSARSNSTSRECSSQLMAPASTSPDDFETIACVAPQWRNAFTFCFPSPSPHRFRELQKPPRSSAWLRRALSSSRDGGGAGGFFGGEGPPLLVGFQGKTNGKPTSLSISGIISRDSHMMDPFRLVLNGIQKETPRIEGVLGAQC